MWHILWDPTQATATRLFAIQKDGIWYAYKTADGCKAGWTCVNRRAPEGRGAERRFRVNWDLTKNICEIYGQTGYIRTLYTYSPYGVVSVVGDVEQPIQWSGEFFDINLGLVYYNYRYYNCYNSRWISRDLYDINDGYNLYRYCNNSLFNTDYLGLSKGNFKGFVVELLGKQMIKKRLVKSEHVARALIRKGKNIYVCNGKDVARKLAQKVGHRRPIHDIAHGQGYKNHFHISKDHGAPHIFYGITAAVAASVSESSANQAECEYEASVDELVAIKAPYEAYTNRYVLENVMDDHDCGAIYDFLNPWTIIAMIESIIGNIFQDDEEESVGYEIKITSKKTDRIIFSMILDTDGNPATSPQMDYGFWLSQYEEQNGKIDPMPPFEDVLQNILEFIMNNIK